MACEKAKTMTFRVYEYDLPKDLSNPSRMSNADAKYHDTGKEFTVSADDEYVVSYNKKHPPYCGNALNQYSIPYCMVNKLYGFNSRFAEGFAVIWITKFIEGYIGDTNRRIWFIKRVL